MLGRSTPKNDWQSRTVTMLDVSSNVNRPTRLWVAFGKNYARKPRQPYFIWCFRVFFLMAFNTLSLLHFPPLRYAPAFSTPAFSAPPFMQRHWQIQVAWTFIISRRLHHWLRGRTTNCSLLLIYRPQQDERLKRPGWLTYSGRFTHVTGHQSAVGWAQYRESSPVKDRRSTTARFTESLYCHFLE